MGRFCMGSGITMGTTGLKWSGQDPDDDCVMLWTETFGVTNVGRAVIACVVMFLLALVAQYVTTTNGNRRQSAKESAKRQRVSSLLSLYYDPERGNKSNAIDTNQPIKGVMAYATETAHLLSSVHPSVNDDTSASTASFPTESHIQPLSSLRAPLVPQITTMSTTRRGSTSIPGIQSSGATAGPSSSLVQLPVIPKVSNWEHFNDSLLHGLHIFLAYLLMLAAMTYDIALIMSIVLGFTVGFFLFTKDTAKVPASADPCCS